VPAVSSNHTDAESTCDVLVVGSGASGLTAAIAARCNGLDVCVVEKQAVIGGCSAYSHGMLWIPGNPVAGRAGVADDPDAARTYLRSEMGDAYDAAREQIDAFLENGPRMVAFLEQTCGLRFELREGFPDYHSERPGAAQNGRTIVPASYDARLLGQALHRLQPPRTTLWGMSLTPSENRLVSSRSAAGIRYLGRRLVRHIGDLARHGRTTQLGGGNALMAGLLKAAIDHGVPIHTETRLRELQRDGQQMTVAELESQGRRRRVFARRGIVLACGGFGHDDERCAQAFEHAAPQRESWSLAPPGCDGDGVRLALQLGAVFESDLSNAAFWAPASRLPGANGSLSTHSHDRFRPGFIAVTETGQRFANEADSNHHFCEALLHTTASSRAAAGWLVCDRRALLRTGLGDVIHGAPFPVRRHIRSGYLIERDRLDALAQAMGMDPAVFCETVDHFNESARRGEDPAFGKGKTRFNRAMGSPAHPANPCLGPLEHRPYYAVRFGVAHMATLAGLRTDLHGRVLDGAGQPIPGLYATGNDRVNLFRGRCPGGGITLAPGMTWSYLLALELAGVRSAALTAQRRRAAEPQAANTLHPALRPAPP
jgi:glycine/D-amino acid oxidase-like deaminating enzyme